MPAVASLFHQPLVRGHPRRLSPLQSATLLPLADAPTLVPYTADNMLSPFTRSSSRWFRPSEFELATSEIKSNWQKRDLSIIKIKGKNKVVRVKRARYCGASGCPKCHPPLTKAPYQLGGRCPRSGDILGWVQQPSFPSPREHQRDAPRDPKAPRWSVASFDPEIPTDQGPEKG